VDGRDLAEAAEKIAAAQLSYRQAKVAETQQETERAQNVMLH
jgi:hypothetical protein